MVVGGVDVGVVVGVAVIDAEDEIVGVVHVVVALNDGVTGVGGEIVHGFNAGVAVAMRFKDSTYGREGVGKVGVTYSVRFTASMRFVKVKVKTSPGWRPL